MSLPLLPFTPWVDGTDPEQPWNDNALRNAILAGVDVNNATTAQPSLTSPADDYKAYIIQSTHTGTQWATFTPKSVAIFVGGGWYEFTPVEGARISIGGTSYIYTSGAWTAAGGAGAGKVIPIACSDEITPLTAGASKVTFRMPYAMTVTAVRASLTTAQASGSIFTVDINESGASILSTKLTIDNTEKTSTTAATPPVISDANLADDAEITIDIDQIGTSGAAGLKVYLIGT